MAVIDEVPGLKAEIVVDNQPLREFDDDHAETNAMTKYIEASSGKKFALKLTFSPPFPTDNDVEARLSVDGTANRYLAYKSEALYRASGHFKSGISFQEDGKWYRQDYQFTALNIVEENDHGSAIGDVKNELKSTGSIKVTFRFIKFKNSPGGIPRGERSNDLSVMGAVPEKALKGDARSHQATLGTPRPTAAAQPGLGYTCVSREPFAEFTFKYRSLAALKALQIIKDDDEHGAVSVERKGVNDGGTSQRGQARFAPALRSEGSQTVKQESDSRRQVKREHTQAAGEVDDDELTIVSVRTRKRQRGEPEVIVLD